MPNLAMVWHEDSATGRFGWETMPSAPFHIPVKRALQLHLWFTHARRVFLWPCPSGCPPLYDFHSNDKHHDVCDKAHKSLIALAVCPCREGLLVCIMTCRRLRLVLTILKKQYLDGLGANSQYTEILECCLIM